METDFAYKLRVLTNALRFRGFRFILIGHNRDSLYVDIAEQLRTTFADRPFLELRLRDKSYRQIADEILSFPNGIVVIPDFDWLLQPGNEIVRIAFNQRRDAFARLDSAFICFIEPGSWRSVAEKLPDWWSLRSLELDFHRVSFELNPIIINPNFEYSSLGGNSKVEKEAEIDRLIQQLDTTEPTNKPLRQSLYSQIGLLSLELSDYETALAYLQQSLRIQQEIGDKRGEGATLNNISQIYKARSDYETALTYLQQSLSIAQQIGDKRGEGATLNNISQIYDVRGDYETTLTYLQKSLNIQQEIGDKHGEGATLNNISQIYKAQGDYETALTYLQQSLSIRQQISDNKGEGATLNNISQIYKAQGDYETALTFLQQSLSIARQIGDKRGEGTALNNISQIYKARGYHEIALTYLQQSLNIQQEIGDKKGEGATLNNISQIYDAQGDYESALMYLQQSLNIQRQISDKKGEGATLNNISQIYKAQGDHETALTYLQKSLNIAQQIGDKNDLAITLHNMGSLYFEQFKDVEQAIGLFWPAYLTFKQLGSPNTEVTGNYLGAIIKEIGEDRFQQILQSIQNQPEP